MGKRVETELSQWTCQSNHLNNIIIIKLSAEANLKRKLIGMNSGPVLLQNGPFATGGSQTSQIVVNGIKDLKFVQ